MFSNNMLFDIILSMLMLYGIRTLIIIVPRHHHLQATMFISLLYDLRYSTYYAADTSMSMPSLI